MKFYIVTPAYNSLHWLEGCVRSVADQVAQDIEVHHHVQDGASEDGTVDWLESWQASHAGTPGYTFTYESQLDAGMYAAINQAWDNMPSDADVTAHLNSDEQYLAGAFQRLSKEFARRTGVEVILGAYLILDASGRYVCHRRPTMPHAWISASHCEIITCSCFYRTPFFRKRHVRYDEAYRVISDLVTYGALVKTAVNFGVYANLVTSAYILTGQNLSWSEAALEEWTRMMASLPWYASFRHKIAHKWSNLLRVCANWGCDSPGVYAIYTAGSPRRKEFTIQRPTCRWNKRTQGEQ